MAKQPDPDAAARAAKLHEEIERLKRNDEGKAPSAESAAAGKRPMSPREFIQKRMAELDKKNK